ncbi:ubiquitin-like [Mastacembelus armatus]|uniref:ubiquitin-like n=1 Tax=Mastacembelus armatus TaxID=205130 RepID=UPI000E4607C6|nr:ubiquitin-like [Mastacembelus armatus]
MVFRVIVKGLRGDQYDIYLCDSEEEFKKVTVEELRLKVAHKEGVPSNVIRLIFEGRQLKDNCLLWECGVQHMSTIYLVKRSQGGSRPDEDHGGMGDKDKNQSMEKLAFF